MDHPLCVIYNPVAARGRAAARLLTVREALKDKADFLPTQGPGHAIELARQAALAGYETVAAAGGDGTVHEVANGLLQADRTGPVFAVFPLGSANDYALALAIRLEEALDSAKPRAIRP